MAALLRERGYAVTGLTRPGRERGDAPDGVTLRAWDMLDGEALARLLSEEQPDELYNFAAYSTGSGMYDDPVGIGDVNGLTVTRILEAIRAVSPSTRFAQASSAEMFGAASGSPQNEASRFDPRSPYGAAKLYAHNMVGLYRARFGTFACSAILFNHESPLRPPAFVTRKITRAAAAISLGLARELKLGDLSARRDWGFAGDTVRAMWSMLQREVADDYVIATGVTRSVAELCELAFRHVGLDYHDHVVTESQPFRAPEPLQLVGDARKANAKLGWSPTVGFERLVTMMVDADLDELRTHDMRPE